MNDRQQLALLRKAERHFKNTTKGWKEKPVGGGSEWKAGMEALQKVQRDLAAKPPWANIGPVVKEGASLLDMSLTHKTSGIPLYPAIDLAWSAHVPLIAPEGVTVWFKDTSASPGEALYLKGVSGMLYWFGHLDRDWPLGVKFRKGQIIARTYDQMGVDHGHIGVNATAFLGAGKQLKYGRNGNGPDYTLGAPTIREQLRRLEL